LLNLENTSTRRRFESMRRETRDSTLLNVVTGLNVYSVSSDMDLKLAGCHNFLISCDAIHRDNRQIRESNNRYFRVTSKSELNHDLFLDNALDAKSVASVDNNDNNKADGLSYSSDLQFHNSILEAMNQNDTSELFCEDSNSMKEQKNDEKEKENEEMKNDAEKMTD
jgi:hypothetical protein